MEATNEIKSKARRKMAKNKAPLESWEQEKIFKWRDENKHKYTELSLLHSSGNGLRLTPGQAVKAKKQGLTKGVPDIFLPLAMQTKHGDCHGLFIELKRLKCSKVSPEQKIFMAALKEQNFDCHVCYGHIEAIKTIKEYLGIKD